MSLAARVVSTELRKILAYRSDFWVNFLGQALVQLFIARALWEAIFLANDVQEMQGMTLPQLTLYYLLTPLTMKILMGENIGFLSREIYEGGLNRYLVWPLSALGYKILTYLTYSSFYLLQLAVLYTLGRLYLNPAPYAAVELVSLVAGVGYILVASVGYFCLMALCEMVAFWADNTWTLGVMLRFVAGFLGGAFLPLSFFPAEVQTVLGYLPFAAMVSTPVNLILGRIGVSEALASFGILVLWLPILGLGVRLMWKRGNLRYTGVGL